VILPDAVRKSARGHIADTAMAQKLDTPMVKALAAPATGNRITYDFEVKGFGCRVTAAGAKSFVLNYRAGGRERRYTIGSFDDWSVTAARNEAKRLKREIDRGRDPMAEREHDRQAPTMAELCDRYLAEHVEVHNKPRTRAEVWRMADQIVKPKLGRLKVEALDRQDVMKLHRELAGTPRQANHVLAILSKMLNLSELWRMRPDGTNPCRHVRRYPEAKRERFLSAAELERLGAALREMEATGAIRPEVAACIRFLALTGCRLGEAVGATWDAIDAEAGVWRLSDAKAGARTVALGAPALALLTGLARSGDRVFADASGKPVTTNVLERAWIGEKAQPEHRRRARPGVRDRAGVPDVRLHDLRHTLGTYAGSAGLNAFLVRDLLGHKTMTMAGRYVSRNADPLRAAADVVSAQIAAALDGKPAEVVELRKAR
jgi:integrase